MVRLPSVALRCRSNCQLDYTSPEKSRVITAHREQLSSLDELYNVEKDILGSGGFGIVRRASLRSGGPSCAVKTIAKINRIAKATADSEAQILQGLAHPGICKLLHVCEDPKHIHLVLECVNGHDLFEEIIPQRPVTESRTMRLMEQVFEALEYCHTMEYAVIHRDLKPENIMVSDKEADGSCPQVKIIDWGLAVVCRTTVETPIVGTACYMSPEAFSRGVYSRASDMWSAGVVMYVLLTGGDILRQSRPLSAFDSSQARKLQDLGTSQSALDLLHGFLKSSPDERFTAASALRLATARPSLDILQLSGAHSADAVDLETDFVIFDDLIQVGEPPSEMTKQQCRQLSDGIHNEVLEDQVLQEASMTANKPSRPCASVQDHKENIGPGAPHVCKHVPPAASSKRKAFATRASALGSCRSIR
jgi:serine/threonine protein kinase